MKHTSFFTLSCKFWRLTVGCVKAVLSGPTAGRGRQPQGLLAPLLMYQQADTTGPRDVPSGRASTHFLGKRREKRDSGTKQRCHARPLYSSFLRLPTHPSLFILRQPATQQGGHLFSTSQGSSFLLRGDPRARTCEPPWLRLGPLL